MSDEKERQDSYSGSQRSPLSSPTRSEFDFINSLRRHVRRRSSLITHHSSLSSGIGDDAAVIRQHALRDMVITADLLVEEIDFRLDSITPRLLGHRALAVSLSDIAAMGARPRWALVSIGMPREIWRTDFVDEFYEGFFALAEEYGVALIGGDTSRTPERIVIDSIVMGETFRGRAVFRSGARPGDHIFVTGSLGGAAAGLKLLERGIRLSGTQGADSQIIEQLLLRQLRPEPRIAWGALLSKELLATAMIDLSDGLSSDLAHLCEESGVGAFIDAARIPVDPSVAHICGRRALDPLLLALHGGEDFELLFTVNPRDLKYLPRAVGGVEATYIGDITRDAGRIYLIEGAHHSLLEPRGFVHF